MTINNSGWFVFSIRTHAIKFMEMVILTQSNKPQVRINHNCRIHCRKYYLKVYNSLILTVQLFFVLSK
jgi:hypothetical protein